MAYNIFNKLIPYVYIIVVASLKIVVMFLGGTAL